MMTLDAIAAVLDRLRQLDGELRRIRSAPPTADELLAAARRDLERDAAQFRADPWTARAGLRGAFAALQPKETWRFVEDQVRTRAAADPREALDADTRAACVAAAEEQIAEIAGSLDRDDLRTLRRAADNAHATYRGLDAHRDEIQQRADRRAAAIAHLAAERERPPPLVSGPDTPPPLSAEGALAVDGQRDVLVADLERDRAELAESDAACDGAAAHWRQLAALAEQCERVVEQQRRPAAAA